MKKLLLFAMAIIFAMQLSAQTTIIVGDTNTATTSTNIPMYCYYQNSYSQSIYPAANLEPGQITSISYYHTHTPYNNGIIKIYMKEVTESTLTNYLPGTDFVQVYEGPINLVNGVVTYFFTAPFEYTGEGNLLVAVIRDGTNYQSDHTFRMAQGIGSSVYQRSDTQEYNINTPPSPYSPAESIVPVTKFTMIPIGAEFCYPPINLAVSEQTTEGATISWEASDESATTFGLAYKSATDEEWTIADENITDLTYTLSGLESNVEYEVKVYTVCSESNSTEISAVFTTLPSEDNFITLPFEEGFDDLENLTLWTITNPHTNKWYVGPLGQNTTNAEAGNGLYISNDEGVSNAYTNNATSVAHASVLINIEENTFYGISFDYKSVGEGTCCDYVGVRLVPFGQDLGTSDILSHMIDKSPYGTNNEWQRVNIEVPTSTTPGAYNLVFSWRNDSGGGENPPAAIDNVSIYTMPCASTAINSSLTFVDTEEGPSISVTLVDTMNTEGTYTLKYKAAASETWTIVEGLTINDFPFSISEGISYQTTYNVQVGIICDDLEEVSYADQMNITIPCGALETPWTETFDANPFAGDISCWNRYTGQIPASGQIATTSLNISSSNWNYTTSISIGGQSHVAMYCNPYSTGQHYWLVTPSIDLGDGDVAKQLAFNVGLREYNNDAPPASAPDDKFIAMVSLDNGATWDIANGLVFFDGDENTNLNFSSLTNQMVRYFYPLVNADGEPLTGAVRFAFYAESTISNGDNRLCVDDIAVEDMVDCPAPYSATVDAASVTATSATASFTYYGTSTTWEYVVVEGEGEEADPDSGSAEEISSTDAIELTDLTPATTYTFAVRAICESGESTWTTTTFSTLEEAELIPYETTFDDEGTWFVNAGSNTSNAWVVGEGTGNEAPAAYISNDGSAYAASTTTSATISHLWKDFDFGQTEENFELSFDWKVTGHQVGTSVSGGVAVYLVERQPLPTTGLLNSDNIVAILVGSDQWQTERIFLGNVTGEKRLVFTALGYINQEELVAPAAIDNVSLSISPCAQVQDVDVTNPTTTTLDVTWTLTEADSYTISYRAAGSEEILTETATESPFTLTDLEPETQYYVSVTAVCGSDEAIPSSTVVAYTLQDAVAIPYTCDFEEENHGWILKNASFANQWHVGTPADSTNGKLYISNNNGASANYNTDALSCVVAEKLFQLGATDSIRISFDLTIQGEFEDWYGWVYAYDYLKVFFVDPETLIEPTSNIGNGFPASGDGTGVIAGYNSDAPILAMLNGTQNISVTIENTPNALKKLVFMWVNDDGSGNQPPAIIDNVMVEPVGIETSCARPVASSVVASNETTTSATISWTDNDESHSAWNVYYKLSSEEEYSMVSASETTIELTDLLPSSTYSVYVTTDCGDEESNPTATITFNTLCDVISDFPYFQGFEAGINCWTAEEIVAFSQLWGLTDEVYLYTESTPVIEGTQAAWHTYNGGESSRLITPTFDLTSLTNPYISFYYALGSWHGLAESLTVQYRASVEDTWTELGTFTTPLDQWVLDSIALPNPSATYQIAFVSLGVDGYGVGLDAITVYDAEEGQGGTDPEPQPCDAPTNLSANNITETSAEITWNGTASTYELKVNGGAAETLTTTTKTLTGLTANTAYTVEVRAVCEDQTSEWVSTTFTTLEEQGGTDPEPQPCDAPTNLSASNITETSAEITWNGTATTYEFKLNGGTAETLTTTTKALTGLTPNTAYTVEVRSICENQTSEWVSANFTTLEEQVVIVLGEVTTSPATNLGNTSATLNGALVNAGESENFTVGFALSTTADFTLEDAGVQNITATLNANTFSQAVNDLTEGQTYFYRAYITNEAGTAYGTVETFTLLGLTDAVANQIAVSLYPNPASDNATLDINGLNQDAKIVISDLQGRILSQDNINAGTTRYTINVSDMTSGVYYIRIITDNVVSTQKLIVE